MRQALVGLSMRAFNLRYWLRYKARQLARARALPSIEVDGVQVLLGDHIDPLTLGYLDSGIHEMEIRDAILAHVRPSDTVMELGTGLGYITVLACRRVGSEHVLTIEANPLVENVLRATFALNGVDPHLICGAMLSKVSGARRKLYLTDCVFESSAVAERERYVWSTTMDTQVVMRDAKPSVLIVDIEGGERELLEYMDEPRNVRLVILELHVRELGEEGIAAVKGRMESWGFNLAPPTPMNRSYLWKPNYVTVWRR